MNKYLLLAIAVLIFGGVNFAQAQEQRPDEFFERDFAEGPVMDSEVQEDLPEVDVAKPSKEDKAVKPIKPNARQERSHDNWSAQGAAEQGEEAEEEDGNENGKEGEQEAAKEEDEEFAMDDTKGTPVAALSAILNVDEERHFNKNFERFFDVVNRHNLSVGTVYAISGADDFSVYTKVIQSTLGQRMLEFSLRGGKLQVLDYIPSEYQVTRSPTWVVETKKGRYLLEGIEKLSRYFNKRGEFVARE